MKDMADSKTSNPSIPQLPISPPTSGSNLWRKTNKPAGDGVQHVSTSFLSDSFEHDRISEHSLAVTVRGSPRDSNLPSMIRYYALDGC
jgi:hypothetical protein